MEGLHVKFRARQVVEHRGQYIAGIGNLPLDIQQACFVFGCKSCQLGRKFLDNSIRHRQQLPVERFNPLQVQEHPHLFVGKCFDGGLGVFVQLFLACRDVFL